MYCVIKGHDFLNEIQTITQVFYPNERFIRVDRAGTSGITAVSEFSGTKCLSEIFHDSVSVARYDLPIDCEDIGYCVKKSMFLCLIAVNGYIPDWGMLTGIRPSKLAHKLRESGLDVSEVIRHFAERFYVSRRKSELCLRVVDAQEKVVAQVCGRYSVYIGIPFCPSRCLYCSFTSEPISGITDEYLAALEKELFAVAKNLGDDAPDAIYIGGGTPTSLNLFQLERLCNAVDHVFPNRAEYTIEAGRPDTIDREKLRLFKEHNVTRLSINPQTMHDKTLQLIGRRHTWAQFLRAYEMARDIGHWNLNVDLILGLPNENEDDVRTSLEAVLALKPENLTAHILAVKRASRLKEELNTYVLTRYGIEEMLKATEIATQSAGMYPYYIYRQKNMLGNFENVGYTTSGFDCVYNVMIMSERQTILAFGAGAITKTVDAQRIERIFNVKSVDEYIRRIDEMIERKREWFDRNSY